MTGSPSWRAGITDKFDGERGWRETLMLEEDMANCREIRYTSWSRRSRLQRVKEWFWDGLDLRLARWSATRGYTPPQD